LSRQPFGSAVRDEFDDRHVGAAGPQVLLESWVVGQYHHLALPSETGELLGQEVDAQVVEGMYGVVDDEEPERFVAVKDGERGEQQGIALAAA
jgi:hypothetical protein